MSLPSSRKPRPHSRHSIQLSFTPRAAPAAVDVTIGHMILEDPQRMIGHAARAPIVDARAAGLLVFGWMSRAAQVIPISRKAVNGSTWTTLASWLTVFPSAATRRTA